MILSRQYSVCQQPFPAILSHRSEWLCAALWDRGWYSVWGERKNLVPGFEVTQSACQTLLQICELAFQMEIWIFFPPPSLLLFTALWMLSLQSWGLHTFLAGCLHAFLGVVVIWAAVLTHFTMVSNLNCNKHGGLNPFSCGA